MNTDKFREFFNSDEFLDVPIHIIGCGAVGSTIAENLARLGVKDLTLYDFDYVCDHNIANQMFRAKDIGKLKVDALTEIIHEIDPMVQVTKVHKGWKKGAELEGYVFLCVDSIELRKQIYQDNELNMFIKRLYDVRIRLTDAQSYMVDWTSIKSKKNFYLSMNFTDEEAKAQTPMSACNLTLSVAPTVRVICGFTITNFMNQFLDKSQFTLLDFDVFNHTFTKF